MFYKVQVDFYSREEKARDVNDIISRVFLRYIIA